MELLCKIREVQRALEVFEATFEKINDISLKEGMIMCWLSENECNASDLAGRTEMSCSNCSKIISSLEKKGFITRNFGKIDKRNMLFSLTKSGENKLAQLKINLPEIPEFLKH